MKRIGAVSLFVAGSLLGFQYTAQAQTAQLDDFEADSIRIVNPSETDPQIKYLWNQYEGDFYAGPDPGSEKITTSQAHTGTRSLQIDVTGGNVYMQFYPATNDWGFMHDYVQPKTAWTAGKYNAVRFWVKVPPQMKQAGGGNENVQIGTYVRAQNGDRGTQGNHYYHFYDFKYTGEWEQVILDSHPTYLIGGGGNNEVGNVPTVSAANWTYIDALTRFYFDGQRGLSSVPATFYFDGFELFTRPANENIDQVYNIHAVYVPSTNEVAVGWSRRKDQDSLTYEVRYSFTDLNASGGWDAGTPAPNGTLKGDGTGAYNLLSYSTTGINVSGKSTVYVAIKPTTASTFRQIAIPVTKGTTAKAPNAPTDVHVQ